MNEVFPYRWLYPDEEEEFFRRKAACRALAQQADYLFWLACRKYGLRYNEAILAPLLSIGLQQNKRSDLWH